MGNHQQPLGKRGAPYDKSPESSPLSVTLFLLHELFMESILDDLADERTSWPKNLSGML